MRSIHVGAVWTMRKWFARDKPMAARMDALLTDLYRASGFAARIVAPLAGRYLSYMMKREERRLADREG